MTARRCLWGGNVPQGKPVPAGFVPDGFEPDTPPSAASVAPDRTWGDTAKDVGKGILKGAASTVMGLGEMASVGGFIPGVHPAQADPLGLNPAMRHPMFTRAEEATKATNTPQMIGKGIETVAELALPTGKAVRSIPSAARAAGKFQDVMSAARNVPIDISGPGNVALNIQKLAEHGGTMPRAVTQFLRRVTDPEKGPLNYEDARLFASNISRLSADEFGRLTPVVAREVATMRVALNKAVADAAGKAGKGREYAEAMTEYGRAMRLKKAIDDFWTGTKRVAPIATAAGAGTWLTSKVLGALDGK